MKSYFTKISLVFAFAIGIMASQNAQAQSLDFNEFLRAGSEDAGKLMGNYISPFMRGFGYGMAGGWYNTAKPHKSLGFDITVSLNLAKAPDSELLYTFLESDYNNIKLAGGGSTAQLPTIFGGDTNLQLETTLEKTVDILGTPTLITATETFDAPKGLDLSDLGALAGYVPTPTFQIGLGLIKNTELKVRYMPTQETDEYKVSLIGFGLLHDIKQWIPGLKQVPIDISIFAGYTKLNTELSLPSEADGGIPGDNQEALFDVTAITYQVLVSKKLSILTLYGGFGYNNVKSALQMNGTYELLESPDPTILEEFTLTNPVDEEFTSSGARVTVGARLKLAILTIHADYTAQEYNTISAGIGFSIR